MGKVHVPVHCCRNSNFYAEAWTTFQFFIQPCNFHDIGRPGGNLEGVVAPKRIEVVFTCLVLQKVCPRSTPQRLVPSIATPSSPLNLIKYRIRSRLVQRVVAFICFETRKMNVAYLNRALLKPRFPTYLNSCFSVARSHALFYASLVLSTYHLSI